MRESGILLPIFSLASPYGIGTFGHEAYAFVDFLRKAGQTYWQILPVSPTSYGDSPYQSFSAYAGNPFFIDLDLLREEGLLRQEDYAGLNWGSNTDRVDYNLLYANRYTVLQKAFEAFERAQPDDYVAFCMEQAGWLEDYALYMALKQANGGASWQEWEQPLRLRNPQALQHACQQLECPIRFQKALQYWFSRQWKNLKTYANSQGIRFIGDIPIYVAGDSADVWSDPTQFALDEECRPIEVAGCPPDAFSADGQLWGNPLYNWQAMKQDGYGWWIRRIAYAVQLYDVVRIDHFRGFESYFSIPASDDTARNGHWNKGPGMDLFRSIEKKLGKLPIIAEDLGFLTPDVRQMLKDSGFPGMKVLQFAFDSREESDYLPHNYDHHCVVYTGTHDNDTIMGWVKTAPPEDVAYARRYLRISEHESFNWGMMQAAMATTADLCVLQMQDLMGLGSEARMNIPSTSQGNWQWRLTPGCANDWLAGIVAEMTQTYCRENAALSKEKAKE